MKFRSINKFPPVNVGNTVQVTIQDVDKSKEDPQNILFAIVLKKDGEYYQLGNKEGTIEQYYTRSQFDIYPETSIKVNEVSNTKKIRKIVTRNR